MGGDCIGSDLVQISTGYDFVNMVIDITCGMKPSFEKICEPQRAEVRFVFNEKDLIQMEKIKAERPECIYRISEMESMKKDHEVVDSSTRYDYYIVKGEWPS